MTDEYFEKRINLKTNKFNNKGLKFYVFLRFLQHFKDSDSDSENRNVANRTTSVVHKTNINLKQQAEI